MRYGPERLLPAQFDCLQLLIECPEKQQEQGLTQALLLPLSLLLYDLGYHLPKPGPDGLT